MKYKYIIVGRKEAVLVVELNRPAKLNAAPPAMFDELRHALSNLAGARAVLIGGAGRAFCAGAEVGELPSPTYDRGESAFKGLVEHYHPTFETIADLPVPVVTAVRGPAAGIGCSLALAADFCIAGSSAYFLQAFIKVGLVPDGGASWMLPRLVGRARALQMMMLGERIDAETAHHWGMIHRVVPDDQLSWEAISLARKLAAGPTLAFGLLRKGLSFASDGSFPHALAREAENQRVACRSDDAAEGAAAFLEKRRPVFSGR